VGCNRAADLLDVDLSVDGEPWKRWCRFGGSERTDKYWTISLVFIAGSSWLVALSVLGGSPSGRLVVLLRLPPLGQAGWSRVLLLLPPLGQAGGRAVA
jgi:hypothetical protein